MNMPTPRQSFTQSTSTLSSNPRPSTTTTFVAASRSSTTTIITNVSEGKRQPRSKEKQFQMKYGHKHHVYDAEKAPYPVSYDRHILELEGLDIPYQVYTNHAVTLVPTLKEHPPRRILDLGCGSGSWVITAAKEWPNCDVVGFDLVDVQIPVHILRDPAFSRISWVHGNFLSTKLPFGDEEFDHVHIKDIARGVPETKWDFVFAEVNRVLKPGGSVEILEDDILFPVLPRWFTVPLRARVKRTQSIHYPNNTRQSSSPKPKLPPTPPPDDRPSHDHAILEALYCSVFENRFINMQPSALLPMYFATYFRQVQAAPVTNFPMPPVSPPQPLPRPVSPNASVDIIATDIFGHASPPAARPISLSLSSTGSANSHVLSTSASTTDSAMTSLFSTDENNSESFSSAESHVGVSNSRKRAQSTPHTFSSLNTASGPPPPKREMFYSSTVENPTIGDGDAKLLPAERLSSLSERSLSMHLYRSFQNVMSTQESMWEELKDWVRNKGDRLKDLGWDDDDDTLEPNTRRKYEALLERYQEDMMTRVSLWCSLTELGWDIPPKEPLSKAEHIEEERIHRAIKEAMKSATEADMQAPCRSVRAMIGYKEIPRYPKDFELVR